MNIKQVAEKILDRKITNKDGLNITEIANIEQKLQTIVFELNNQKIYNSYIDYYSA